jgi:hypothetical protein
VERLETYNLTRGSAWHWVLFALIFSTPALALVMENGWSGLVLCSETAVLSVYLRSGKPQINSVVDHLWMINSSNKVLNQSVPVTT